MTWLEALNRFVLQWFFVRLARVVDTDTGRTVDWTVLRWIVPTTGWTTPYRYVWMR